MKPVRVLLVDDHTIFRQGTANALRLMGGIEIVGEADNGQDAIELAQAQRPDVILMDLQMPGIGGLDATRRILEQLPETKVIVLSFLDDEASLVSALRSGAKGYLLKNVAPEELWAHVRGVVSGEMAISGSMTMRLISSLEQRQLLPEEAQVVKLTNRERELVGLVVKGLNNQEIARAMFMSVSTVKLHLRNVLQKLNLRNRAELIAQVARHGFSA
jgi:two-component system, NarL family, nitrate/nitrite response regulator NarL